MDKIFKNFLTKLGANTLDISALESLGHDMTTGSNANGTWVRWGNGLQVCFLRRNDGNQYHTFVAELNGVRTGGLEWTYPKTFISEPSGFVNGAILGITRYTEGHSYSNSNFQYRWINHEQSSNGTYDTGIVSFFAIGRWK